MTTVKLLDRPKFVIGATTYTDDELWLALSWVNNWTVKNPLDASLGRKVQDGWIGYNQSFGQEKWKMVDAYYQPLRGYINLRAGVDLPDGACIFNSMKGQYTGYGVSEDYFGPLFLRGNKFLYLQVRSDGLRPGGQISPGFSIAKDFLPGAALVIAVAVTANAAGSWFEAGGWSAGESGAFVGPTEAGALTGPTEWELATGGMGAGMGTGGVPATVIAAPAAATVPAATAPAASGGVFEAIASAGSTTVKTAEAVAGAVVATRGAVDTIQNALNPQTPQNAQKKPDGAPSDDQTYIYAGLALAALAMIG